MFLFDPDSVFFLQSLFSLAEVEAWMLPSWLKFNPDKASVIAISEGKHFVSLAMY